MKAQRVMRVGEVREGCMPGAGATPVLRTSRDGSAALVAPAPGFIGIQQISRTDIERICARYIPDQLSIDH
jgi:hypothetical protein